MSVGELLRVPPSTRTIFWVRTGSKSPGMDIVERIAVVMEPPPQYLAWELTTSPATQTKGMGRSRKEMLSWYPTDMLASRLLTLNPYA